jgi:HAD superfamily hydrolase (TIGR01509 family)
LEVRTLPSALLGWRAQQRHGFVSDEIAGEADRRYRALRADIIDHGNELTAEASLEHVFSQMGLTVSRDDIETGIAQLMRAAVAGASPIPGAIETVRELSQTGAPIGIVSSAVYHPFLEWTLEAFGLRDAFQVIVTSASAGFYKSRPEIFLHAAEALGADPGRMVHVGDSLRFDVGGAGRAGMAAVWLRHVGGRHEADAFTPDLTLETLVAAAPRILDVLASRQPEADGFRA